MRAVLVMTLADLRQRVRDKGVVLFAVVVPLALMAVFQLTLGDLEETELGTVDVVASAPAGDPSADALLDAVRGSGVARVGATDLSPGAARAAVEDGTASVALLVPDDLATRVAAGEGPTVRVVEGDGADLETAVVVTVVDGVLEQLHAATLAATAAQDLGVAPELLAQTGTAVAGRAAGLEVVEEAASPEQLGFGGSVIAGQAGLFLLFTVAFGVLALVAERRQGTMARLSSMPIRPEQVVVAKALVSVVLGLVSTTVLLVAGGLLFGVSFGSPVPVGTLVLAVVLAAVSLTFVVARLARTAEQATMIQQVLALVLGIAGGAFFPLTATGWVGDLLDLNPVAAFTRGLGITHHGGGLADLGVPLATLGGFAVVCVALSRLLPDRGARA